MYMISLIFKVLLRAPLCSTVRNFRYPVFYTLTHPLVSSDMHATRGSKKKILIFHTVDLQFPRP